MAAKRSSETLVSNPDHELHPLVAGKLWILLRSIIGGFYKNEYPFRIFQIEYIPGRPGFSKSKSDRMTAFVMLLASVCKDYRAVLRSKCVFRAREWDFAPNSIDPPPETRMAHVTVPHTFFGGTSRQLHGPPSYLGPVIQRC